MYKFLAHFLLINPIIMGKIINIIIYTELFLEQFYYHFFIP